MKLIAYLTFIGTSIFCSAHARDTKCDYDITNSAVTAEKVGPDFGDAVTFKVHGTGSATYTHKDGSSKTEIVNLDQGATVVVPASAKDLFAEAKNLAEDLLDKQATTRLAELCRANGCNN